MGSILPMRSGWNCSDKGQHVIERINKLLVELAVFSPAEATVDTHLDASSADVRSHACDVVPLSAEWTTSMAPPRARQSIEIAVAFGQVEQLPWLNEREPAMWSDWDDLCEQHKMTLKNPGSAIWCGTGEVTQKPLWIWKGMSL